MAWPIGTAFALVEQKRLSAGTKYCPAERAVVDASGALDEPHHQHHSHRSHSQAALKGRGKDEEGEGGEESAAGDAVSRYRLRPTKPGYAKPSKRAIRNTLAIYQALHDNTTPVIEQASVKQRTSKPRAEREAGANDALKDWRKYRPDVRFWRNNCGAYPLPSGGWLRYGLCPGSADFIGLRSIIVTPGMVGKRIAVFLAIESKAPGKDAEAHQQTWLDEVRDAGAIAGVARNAQEAEDLLARWNFAMNGDER